MNDPKRPPSPFLVTAIALAQHRIPFFLLMPGEHGAFVPHLDAIFGTQAANKPEGE